MVPWSKGASASGCHAREGGGGRRVAGLLQGTGRSRQAAWAREKKGDCAEVAVAMEDKDVGCQSAAHKAGAPQEEQQRHSRNDQPGIHAVARTSEVS